MFLSFRELELKHLVSWKVHARGAVWIAAALATSCAGAPEPRPTPPAPPTNPSVAPVVTPALAPAAPVEVVSGARALTRAEAWVAHPDGAAAAIRAEWGAAAGEIVPETGSRPDAFWVRFPGRSRDRLVLAVRTPTDLESAVDASLAFEVARAHIERLGTSAPFSLELQMLGAGAEKPSGGSGSPGAGEPNGGSGSPGAGEPSGGSGSQERPSAAAGEIRFAAVLVGSGRDQLRVARDLNAHPRLRELFWEIANRLDFEEIFGPDASFVDTTGSRRVANVAPESVLEIGPVRDAAHRAGCCRAESATAVGRVTLAGLVAIGENFAGIDAYARRPVPPDPWAWADPAGGANLGGSPNVEDQETATVAEPAGSLAEGNEEAE